MTEQLLFHFVDFVSLHIDVELVIYGSVLAVLALVVDHPKAHLSEIIININMLLHPFVVQNTNNAVIYPPECKELVYL